MDFLYQLEARCKDILNTLLYAEDYMSIQSIVDMKKISRRSVYYDLGKINEWLETLEIEPIEVERSKGILINEEKKELIKEKLRVVNHDISYVFSPMERVKIIICTTLKKSHVVNIEDFMNLCQVSRNTIINDLKVVARKLKEFDLDFVYETKKGYRVIGDVVKKRTVFFLYFHSISDFYRRGMIPLDNVGKIDEILVKLYEIEKELEADYVRDICFSIAVFFSTIDARSDSLTFTKEEKEEIENTKEFKLVIKYFSELVENEKIYLALHLLGSRLQTVSMDSFNKDEEAYELAKTLVLEFSRVSCIEFEKIDELERALFLHLKTSLYRYRYGIQLGNPMLDDIKREYADLFEITKKACEYLEQQIAAPIPESEIAYLTLHFGGFINAGREEKKELQILIVCPNGISTGNMLRGEAQNLVPRASRIDVISLSEYDFDHHYDVVISTVEIHDKKHTVIVVHPILTDNDRFLILRKCMKYEGKQRIELNGIIEIVSKYVSDDKLEYLKEDLNHYFSSTNLANYSVMKDYGHGLRNTLPKNHISVCESKVDWKQSIRIAGTCLLNEGVIEQKYIDCIIQKNIEMGPYMFITPEVVLAHAKVEEGANKLGVALTLFKEPVLFEKMKRARIVIVLSAEDQTKHLHILKDIMTIFKSQQNIDDLLVCRNVDSIYDVVNEILDNEDKKDESQ